MHHIWWNSSGKRPSISTYFRSYFFAVPSHREHYADASINAFMQIFFFAFPRLYFSKPTRSQPLTFTCFRSNNSLIPLIWPGVKASSDAILVVAQLVTPRTAKKRPVLVFSFPWCSCINQAFPVINDAFEMLDFSAVELGVAECVHLIMR